MQFQDRFTQAMVWWSSHNDDQQLAFWVRDVAIKADLRAKSVLHFLWRKLDQKEACGGLVGIEERASFVGSYLASPDSAPSLWLVGDVVIASHGNGLSFCFLDDDEVSEDAYLLCAATCDRGFDRQGLVTTAPVAVLTTCFLDQFGIELSPDLIAPKTASRRLRALISSLCEAPYSAERNAAELPWDAVIPICGPENGGQAVGMYVPLLGQHCKRIPILLDHFRADQPRNGKEIQRRHDRSFRHFGRSWRVRPNQDL